MVKTAGQRKGSKVLGLIDSFTGCCFYQGQEGRLGIVNLTTDTQFPGIFLDTHVPKYKELADR
jgi:hypothetical protein